VVPTVGRMEHLELTPNLHLLRFGVGQAYLWRDGDDLTLIDSGPPGSGPAIAAAARGLGTLRRLVLTHFHDDHTGSAAEIGSWSGVTVLAHRADAPIVRSERPGPPPDFAEFERELHAQLAHELPPAPPARVDVELDGGEELDIGDSARVLHVPGHTDGSIALHPQPAAGLPHRPPVRTAHRSDLPPGRRPELVPGS
jgi:glyoxylase-like metal-dependent hydrolase (beta-lactamase superfamily II)